MKKELIIFDVCNTLYDSNTTFDFIRFVLKKNPGKLFYLNALTKKFSPFFIGWTLLGKIKQRDIVRARSIALLKGIRKQELLHLAEDFFHGYLKRREITDVLRLLEEKKPEHDVWLFSNSVEPVIQVIAKYLNVNYEATQLEYDDNNVFTGNIQRDLSGQKQNAFTSRFGKEVAIKMMCTDNKSDHEILKLAKKAIVVVYKPSDKKFWRSINPEFIEKF